MSANFWTIWRGRGEKVKGVAICYRASDIALELRTMGLTDEVEREKICRAVCECLNALYQNKIRRDGTTVPDSALPSDKEKAE